MKKSTKVLALVFLGLFMISMLAGIVSAAWNIKDNFIDALGNFGNINSFQDFLQTFFVPEILFGILIFLVIFAIVDQISLFSGSWIKITISIVLAVLAGGFIDVQILQPILNQYTALGITISFLLPFALIFYFLYIVAPDFEGLHKVVWIVYGVAIVISAWANWSMLDKRAELIYWGLMVAAIVMSVYGFKISKELTKAALQKKVEEAVTTQKIITAKEMADLERALVADMVPKNKIKLVQEKVAQSKKNLGLE